MISIEVVFGDDRYYAERNPETWNVSNNGEHQTASDSEIAEIAANRLTGGFDRATVFLEDTIMVLHPGKVSVFDAHTGEHHNDVLTATQMDAIIRLALGGDDVEGSEKWYPIAETAIANWPSEIRPIP